MTICTGFPRKNRHVRALSSILLALLLARPVDGFADHLVTSTTGCLTELDPTEVVMNNMIKTAADSDFADMHLAVVAVDDTTVDSSKSVHDEGANAYLFEYPPGTKTVRIKFINPYSTAEYQDSRALQFVVDVVGEPIDVASFRRGAGVVGCDGNRRAASKLKDDESLIVEILKPGETVHLLAGWAAGHEAVRLTPQLVLKSASAAPKPESQKTAPAPPDPKEKEAFDREHPKVAASQNNDSAAKAKTGRNFAYNHAENVKGASKTHGKSHPPANRDEPKEKEPKKDNISKIAGILKDSQRQTIEQFAGRVSGFHKRLSSTLGLDQLKDRKIMEEEDLRRSKLHAKYAKEEIERKESLEAEFKKNFIRSFRSKYESDTFAHRFHMTGYYYGCIILLLSFAIFFFLSGGRREKGRRDL